MNINSIVIAALASLSLPVAMNAYTGTADSYITVNYADERPALRADGTDQYDQTTIQVHYFTRLSPLVNKKAVRRLLRVAGFTIINTSEFYESDTALTHIIVEAWIDGAIDD